MFVEIPPPDERREWIKYQLRIRGSSLAEVARGCGITRCNASRALIKLYPRMEKAIANKIGIPPNVLWPERYDNKGKSLARGRGRPPKSRKKTNMDATTLVKRSAPPAGDVRPAKNNKRAA